MNNLEAHTKADLIKQLQDMGIESSDSILVHSSMKKIGQVVGGADTVLDALSEYMAEGLLVFPTHTWSYINEKNPKFYVQDSPSCVGILPELFRKRPYVVRSLHPTHSVAALGADAKIFVAGDEKMTTPCGKGSPLWKLLQRRGKIMLIGVDLRSNTFIHGIEEQMDVPGRLSTDYEQLVTVQPDGTEIIVPSYRHCGIDWSEHYWKVEDVLLQRGAIKVGQFGDARVLVCDTLQLTEDISAMIADNIDLFTTNTPLTEAEVQRYLQIETLTYMI